MPDPVSLAPSPTAAPAPLTNPRNGAETPNSEDFSAALAALVAAPAADGQPAAPPDAALRTGGVPQALAGARLPLPGNNLPVAGTLAPADAKPEGDPMSGDHPADDSGDKADAQPLAASPAVVLLAPLMPPTDAGAAPATVPPAAAARVAPNTAPGAQPLDQGPDKSASQPAKRVEAAARQTDPAAGAPDAVQLRAAFAPTLADARSGTDSDQPAAAGRPDTGPAPANPAQGLALAAFAEPASSAPASAAPAPAIQRPAGQDLAALVDRLVEARGAAQAGSAAAPVTATLAHAEFGRVAVHFTPDTGGLNVTLSSPDPAFSGAVQAALAVAPGDGGNGAQLFDGRGAGAAGQGRGEASGFAGNFTEGNGGGHTAQNGNSRTAGPRPASNPAAGPASDAGASGIFA